MQGETEIQQSAELRQAFLRQLPLRLGVVRRRGRRLCAGGWDVNVLCLVCREVQILAGACERYELGEMGAELLALESLLAPSLKDFTAPEPPLRVELGERLERLGALLTREGLHARTAANEGARAGGGGSEAGLPTFVVPPAEFVQRYARSPHAAAQTQGVAPATGAAGAAPESKPAAPIAAPASPAPAATSAPATRQAPPTPERVATVRAKPAPEPEHRVVETSYQRAERLRARGIAAAETPAVAPEAPAPARELPVEAPRAAALAPAPAAARPAAAVPRADARRIHHLTDGNPLALELDHGLRAQGHAVETFGQVAELSEALRAQTPAMVVADAAFLGESESIGETVRAVRAQGSRRLAWMALSEHGDVGTRLRAMRAGADSFIPLPASIGDLLARAAELLETEVAEPYRVMIIEDDRSQSLFAETILRKSGIETCAVMDPMAALDALDSFDPELILMDLYMPECDGMELTTLIRQRDRFSNTPIVFLSGEHDPDKRFDALGAGGDDYLEKPIRPKYLISAVTNRVRRARAMVRRLQAQNPRDSGSGLYERSFVLQRIEDALSADAPHTHLGGLLFVIIDGAQAIRERTGLAVFDELLAQAGALLAGALAGTDCAARYGDTSFIVLASGRGEQELVHFGEELKARFEKHLFEVGDKSLTLAIYVGIATFALEWPDAASMLGAAERACALARSGSDGRVRLFETHLSQPSTGDTEALLVQLRDALRFDKFQLVFQPLASLRGAVDEQFQTLLRLRAENGRIHTAATLVPLAEKAGMINGVDRWVLTRCMEVIQERVRAERPLRLFANQSVAAMLDPQRVSWLRDQLEQRRIPGQHLALAFRFADVIPRMRQAMLFCEEVRTLGIKIALGGFEATMASYQMLQHLPLDFLVLAPKYVGDQGGNPKLRQEVRQLVQFAREHDLRLIAPQVEDAQAAAALWTAGVDFIQGNFVQPAGSDLDFDFRASAI